jgi:hypothetical protein
MHKTDAIAPPHLQWTMGKTAATIRFVKDAEGTIDKNEFLGERERTQLRSRIAALKSGDKADDFETVDSWLAAQRPPPLKGGFSLKKSVRADG